jgi:hypothetical protein
MSGFHFQSTVTGECAVVYDISPLPAIVLQQQPELAPLSNATDGDVFDIIKTQNFSNCNERRGINLGINGIDQFEPGQNKMGNLMSVRELHSCLLLIVRFISHGLSPLTAT